MKDILKAIAIIGLLIGLVVGSTMIDYHMFKRSHPNADFLGYWWERSNSK